MGCWKNFYIDEINKIKNETNNIIFSPNDESIIGFDDNLSIYIYSFTQKDYIKRILRCKHNYFNFLDSEHLVIIYNEAIEIRKINPKEFNIESY